MNQKINCNVCSCEYNEEEEKLCNLEEIDVNPVPDNETGNPEESMCGSYKCGDKNHKH